MTLGEVARERLAGERAGREHERPRVGDALDDAGRTLDARMRVDAPRDLGREALAIDRERAARGHARRIGARR